jgi:5-methylcytosine-specific restriction endonuclease McrA
MPWSPPRPCLTCGQLGCSRHRRTGRWPERPSRHVRGYGTAWDRLRQLALERDGYACVHCRSTDRVSVDHVIPKVRGGLDALGNLQTLCKAHHDAKSAAEGNAAKRRGRVKVVAWPSAVPRTTVGSTDSPAAFAGPMRPRR